MLSPAAATRYGAATRQVGRQVGLSASPPSDERGLIRAALAGRVDEECRIEGPLAVDGSASIYRVTAGAGGPGFAAKICADPADARLQFAALEAAAAAMNGALDGGCRVPQPIALAEEQGLVVMEWVDGRSLAGLLHAPLAGPGVVLDAAARAGAWLARYHATGPIAAAPFDYAAALARLEPVLATLGPDDPARRPAEAWLDRLRRTAGRHGSTALPIRLHHGDFKPANVLLTDGAVYGIDLHSRYRSSVAQDLVHFVVDMELACFHPPGWRLLPWRRALTRRFLAAYGSERWPGLDAVVDWLRLHEIVRTWATFHAERPPGRRRAYAAACLRLLARNCLSPQRGLSSATAR
jgi:Ser/Thr protein kinase RdoA (MazF antagonist)